MVGQKLVEIVAQVPADTEAVGGDLHQLALGAQILQKENKLELKENHRVDRGPPARSIAVSNQFAYEREVDGSFQTTIEVILGDEIFEREIFEG